MTNSSIANAFQTLAKLMELHGENPFKIRSYQTAYRTIKGLETPLSEMPRADIQTIKGIGKAIFGKIEELLDAGVMNTLEKYKSQTPTGLIEILSLKGIGAKKLAVVWKELEVEDAGELLYACYENRLVDLKGFGAKTQDDWIDKLQFLMANRGKKHLAKVWDFAQGLLQKLQNSYSTEQFAIIGDVAAQYNVINEISLLTTLDYSALATFPDFSKAVIQENDSKLTVQLPDTLPIHFHRVDANQFVTTLLKLTSSEAFLAHLASSQLAPTTELSAHAFFETVELPYISPVVRKQTANSYTQLQDDIVQVSDIKGLVHCHSTWSDGGQSIENMALHAKAQGLSYMLLTDHSKTAVYANGLSAERVLKQWEEIDALNAKMDDFKILKGIESDILRNGDLDYEQDILEQFDLIIGSIHSGLKMDKETATNRLIKAIENPNCHMLGHPTGRLLLAREGYPLDFEKVIDACAQNGVSIELNANPYRLDLDPVWIQYAVEKGIKISINPDAHSLTGIEDIKWGVLAAQSGGLTKDMCLNAMQLDGFLAYFNK